MSTYWNDFLVHSGKGSSWEKKKHKYISKEFRDGKMRYIYAKVNNIENKISGAISKNR